MQGHETSIWISASPEQVYNVVSDVTRTSEWSPVCRRVEWVGEVREPVAGARFLGHNREGPIRWSRECVVREADPPRRFVFSTYLKGRESTRWSYTLTPEGSGTMLTESYEPVWAPAWIRFAAVLGRPMMERNARQNLQSSLDRIKALVEGVASST